MSPFIGMRGQPGFNHPRFVLNRGWLTGVVRSNPSEQLTETTRGSSCREPTGEASTAPTSSYKRPGRYRGVKKIATTNGA